MDQNPKIITRANHAVLLSGLDGAALDTALSFCAPIRHASRVVATIDAARQYLLDLGISDPDPMVIAGIIAADIHQSGGCMGLGGPSGGTDRILSGLGKSRFAASDGGAYYAAAKDAVLQVLRDNGRLQCHLCSPQFLVCDSGICFGVDHYLDSDGHDAFLPLPSLDIAPRPLLDRYRCIMRRALYDLVPRGPDAYDPHTPFPILVADPAALSKLHNRLCERG
jgi:hypothetical protein